MKKLLIAAIISMMAAASQAADLATARTKHGTLYLTDTPCADKKPANAKLIVLRIRHEQTKSGAVLNGRYAAFEDGTVFATFEDGSEYEYKLEQFQWTDEALRRLDSNNQKHVYKSTHV